MGLLFELVKVTRVVNFCNDVGNFRKKLGKMAKNPGLPKYKVGRELAKNR